MDRLLKHIEEHQAGGGLGGGGGGAGEDESKTPIAGEKSVSHLV